MHILQMNIQKAKSDKKSVTEKKIKRMKKRVNKWEPINEKNEEVKKWTEIRLGLTWKENVEEAKP